MIKASFMDKQPEVRITKTDSAVYYQIALNETEKTTPAPEGIEGASASTMYEYDFNEWHDSGEVDEADVKANPSNYLNYVPKISSVSNNTSTMTQTLTERVSALEENSAQSADVIKMYKTVSKLVDRVSALEGDKA